MNRVHVMYFLIHFILFLCTTLTKGEEFKAHNLTIRQLSDKIVHLFGAKHQHERIKELQGKINTINNYVIDSGLFFEKLLNITSETDLNNTNFFNSLSENDHFRFLTANDTNNLYLKLKAKMNRDDVLNILAVRGEKGKLMKSARRMMKRPQSETDDVERMHDVVDKLIAEVPNDDHKEKAKESIYWDPQGELQDLKQYHDAKRDGRRLYKGERTSIREYPFMASIHIMGRFWCGGVLYWHDLIITSASCLQLMHNNRFFRENPRVVQVRLGSNHSRIGGETIDVLEVYFHPSYNPKTLHSNLAVLRLRRHLSFSYHRIPKIIDISHEPSLIPATAEIMVLGWGVTKLSQKLAFEPIFLQRKLLPVYPNTFCKEVYGSKFITEFMFCAGTFTTGEGACDHDAGGPAILSGRLVGIISFGPATCGFANAPTVFTLVGAFADWVETVNESMPNYYRGKAISTTTMQSPFNEYFETWQPPRLKVEDESIASGIQPISVHSRRTTTVRTTTFYTIPTEIDEEITTTTTTTEATTTTAPTPPPGLRQDQSDGGWSIEDLS